MQSETLGFGLSQSWIYHEHELLLFLKKKSIQ